MLSLFSSGHQAHLAASAERERVREQQEKDLEKQQREREQDMRERERERDRTNEYMRGGEPSSSRGSVCHLWRKAAKFIFPLY